MSIITDDSPVTTKIRELCQTILDSAEYNAQMGSVEAFLDNDEARMLYQNVHERSEELRNKQRSGVELSDSEINLFKEARGEMEKNELIMDFLAAQDELQLVQATVSKFVGMSLEYGRIPTEEDFAAMEDGCCGGGCGEGGGG